MLLHAVTSRGSDRFAACRPSALRSKLGLDMDMGAGYEGKRIDRKQLQAFNAAAEAEGEDEEGEGEGDDAAGGSGGSESDEGPEQVGSAAHGLSLRRAGDGSDGSDGDGGGEGESEEEDGADLFGAGDPAALAVCSLVLF
jgi:hypothetical protein